MKIDVLTLFPEMFPSFLGQSIIGQAQKRGLVGFNIVNIRDFAHDRHKVCDDIPYGGGPGMVMKPEPIFEAVEKLKSGTAARLVLLSPRGRVYDQQTARNLASSEHLIFLCGHYKDIDERVRTLVDDDISLGDFILSGGEPAAIAVIDSIVRLLPGAISDPESANRDSFENGLLDHPHYTRPEEFRGMKIPEVLRSGNHANIDRWRRQQALAITQKYRPDLLEKAALDAEDREYLQEYEKNKK